MNVISYVVLYVLSRYYAYINFPQLLRKSPLVLKCIEQQREVFIVLSFLFYYSWIQVT